MTHLNPLLIYPVTWKCPIISWLKALVLMGGSLLTAIYRDTNKDSKTDALTPVDAEGYGLQVDIQ